jgi:hypothetical protein
MTKRLGLILGIYVAISRSGFFLCIVHFLDIATTATATAATERITCSSIGTLSQRIQFELG